MGLYAHWIYAPQVAVSACFGWNGDFPIAIVLQHFNIGYFLYDSIHVVTWDQKFLVHHTVALLGYGSSEYSEVFILANAVNTWIAEFGSLMYSAYLVKKSELAYLAFVVLYTASRFYFLYWSGQVFQQAYRALTVKDALGTAPWWAPYCAASLQLLLLVVNFRFMITHWRKLAKSWGGKREARGE